MIQVAAAAVVVVIVTKMIQCHLKIAETLIKKDVHIIAYFCHSVNYHVDKLHITPCCCIKQKNLCVIAWCYKFTNHLFYITQEDSKHSILNVNISTLQPQGIYIHRQQKTLSGFHFTTGVKLKFMLNCWEPKLPRVPLKR